MSMKPYRVGIVLLGTYDVVLVVKANDEIEAEKAAINEMNQDGIYREGRTEIFAVDLLSQAGCL